MPEIFHGWNFTLFNIFTTRPDYGNMAYSITNRGNTMESYTTEKDIVLIYFEEKPLSFARIESILPDSKPDWYHVKLLLLQLPLQVVTWILRDAYINGETFTMNGKRVRLEKVISPDEPVAEADSGQEPATDGDRDGTSGSRAKVIAFNDLRKH